MNQELLATHQIISMFEKSMSLSNHILDSLPGVLLNLDAKGNILRANITVANELGLDHENVLNTPMSRLFSVDTWPMFESHLQTLIEGRAKSVEFELPISPYNIKPRDYIWQINPVELGTEIGHTAIYTCVGRDISEVKAALAKVVTMAKDLELAETVQNLLLPLDFELDSEKVAMAAFYKSAAIAGGDYWSFDFVGPDKIWILVGDVTGHGAGPAMVTALVSGCIRTLKLAAKSGAIQIDLPLVLSSINQNLLQIPKQPYWMAAVGVEIDLTNHVLNWWSAGAPPMFSVSREGEIVPLSKKSTPLGAGECQLASGTASFEPGRRLLIFTDGISELRNPAGVEFGWHGVKKSLKKSKTLSAVAARDLLLKDIEDWRGDVPADDDITYVLLDRK